jgi:hypothetical protein
MVQAQSKKRLAPRLDRLMGHIWDVINAEKQIPDREESGKIENAVALNGTIAKLYAEYVRQVTAEAIEKGEPVKIYGPQDFIVIASEAAEARLWSMKRTHQR